jgi:hypothetical protein
MSYKAYKNSNAKRAIVRPLDVACSDVDRLNRVSGGGLNPYSSKIKYEICFKDAIKKYAEKQAQGKELSLKELKHFRDALDYSREYEKANDISGVTDELLCHYYVLGLLRIENKESNGEVLEPWERAYKQEANCLILELKSNEQGKNQY